MRSLSSIDFNKIFYNMAWLYDIIMTLPYVPYASVNDEFLGGPKKGALLDNIYIYILFILYSIFKSWIRYETLRLYSLVYVLEKYQKTVSISNQRIEVFLFICIIIY